MSLHRIHNTIREHMSFEKKKHACYFTQQEIEEVLPEVVQTRDTGYKAVKYEKMVPLLIESIKELKSIVETQNTTIKEQQQRLTKLEEKSNG